MVRQPDQECSLRKAHLSGNGLKPAFVLPGGKNADRSGVARKGAVGDKRRK
jgi:hypothetical protein